MSEYAGRKEQWKRRISGASLALLATVAITGCVNRPADAERTPEPPAATEQAAPTPETEASPEELRIIDNIEQRSIDFAREAVAVLPDNAGLTAGKAMDGSFSYGLEREADDSDLTIAVNPSASEISVTGVLRQAGDYKEGIGQGYKTTIKALPGNHLSSTELWEDGERPDLSDIEKALSDPDKIAWNETVVFSPEGNVWAKRGAHGGLLFMDPEGSGANPMSASSPEAQAYMERVKKATTFTVPQETVLADFR